jgi:hypothetical protein
VNRSLIFNTKETKGTKIFHERRGSFHSEFGIALFQFRFDQRKNNKPWKMLFYSGLFLWVLAGVVFFWK